MPISILLLPSNTTVSTPSPQILTNSKKLKAKTLNLESTGRLSLSNAEQTQSIRLADHVEQFWMANTEMEDLGNTMWAYGKEGLQIWFPFFSSDLTSTMGQLSRDASFEFDPEVYPIGFIPEWAVIVGISQHITYSSASNLPFFDLNAKTHPFLHSVLRHELDNDRLEEAIKLGKKYSYVPHFAISLELLLHETLEFEYHNSKKGEILQNFGLNKVVKLLKNFPKEYPAVVVRCARKTDPLYWNMLFREADSPKVLFQNAISLGEVSTAASYLRVIQMQEGAKESRQAALKVLELALDIEDKTLVQDLMRFLKPSKDVDIPLTKSGLDSFVNSISQVGLDDEEYSIQEMIMSRYRETTSLNLY